MKFHRVLWLHVYFFHGIALDMPALPEYFCAALFTDKSRLVNNRESEVGASPPEIHIQTIPITRQPLPVCRFH